MRCARQLLLAVAVVLVAAPAARAGSCAEAKLCCPGRDSSCVVQKAPVNAIVEDPYSGPFLQLSSIDTRTYHTATMLGLLVPQFIAVYIGSTLRSMNEVIESQRIGGGTYFFIASQLVIGVALMVWFSARARKELAKAIAEAENSKLTNGSVV